MSDYKELFNRARCGDFTAQLLIEKEFFKMLDEKRKDLKIEVIRHSPEIYYLYLTKEGYFRTFIGKVETAMRDGVLDYCYNMAKKLLLEQIEKPEEIK